MSCVVAITGEEIPVLIGRETRTVVPFVGADRGGCSSQMGIGIRVVAGRRRTYMWGDKTSHLLIQCWRGMQILKQVPRVEGSTLSACYYAGARELPEPDQYHLDVLAQLMGGRIHLERLRKSVCSMLPGSEELEAMIQAFQERGVEVDAGELQKEFAAAGIEIPFLVQDLIQQTQ